MLTGAKKCACKIIDLGASTSCDQDYLSLFILKKQQPMEKHQKSEACPMVQPTHSLTHSQTCRCSFCCCCCWSSQKLTNAITMTAVKHIRKKKQHIHVTEKAIYFYSRAKKNLICICKINKLYKNDQKLLCCVDTTLLDKNFPLMYINVVFKSDLLCLVFIPVLQTIHPEYTIQRLLYHTFLVSKSQLR